MSAGTQYADAQPTYRGIRPSGFSRPLVGIAWLLMLVSLVLPSGALPQSPDDKGALAEATQLINEAVALHNAGKLLEAELLCRRELEILKKALGPGDSRSFPILNTVAILYSWQYRYAEAEMLFRQALGIREKVLGPDDPDVAASLSSLARLYEAQEKYTRAEPLYRRALAIREKALGPEHPDVATSLTNLGEIYRFQGQYGQAEPLYRRALAILEDALGPEHREVYVARSHLVALLEDVKRTRDPTTPRVPKRSEERKVSVRKFQIAGNTIVPTHVLEALVHSEQGKELTVEELEAVAERITNYYAALGEPLASIFT